MSDSRFETDYGCWRRRKDELLRPDAFAPEDLEDLKANTHNPDFEMLYQQDADSCALPPITKDCFEAFAMPPKLNLPLVISVDTGMSRGPRNSYNTVQVWCPLGTGRLLVDQWREQCDFDELHHHFLRCFRRHRPSAILVEAAANGHALTSLMKSKHSKLIHQITPSGSKTARLRRHIDMILAHRILLPNNAPWQAEFVSEFVQFPYGDFTDQVDATTQYLDYMVGKPHLIRPPPLELGVAINSYGQRIGQGQPMQADCRGAVLVRGRRW